jgi:hypothetical protein
MLGFIGSVDLHNRGASAHPKKAGQLSARELLYQRFLLYREFYVADRPVVVCEGKTDNIYLLHAIRSLAHTFTDLAGVAPDGKISLKIRLFKHSGSRTARIVNLGDGGSGSLGSFIRTYKNEVSKFTAPGQKHPVIILYDNDKGADGVAKGVKPTTVVKNNDGQESFSHLVRNLYSMPTPLVVGAKESKIEDFFEPALKETIVDGKKFGDALGSDKATHYSKTVFAHKVVVPNAKHIDFSRFSPLLANIVAILKYHAGKISTDSED